MQDYAIDYENTEQPVELMVEMYDPEGKKLISRSTPEKLIFEKKVLIKEIELPVKNFEFWSPNRPVLYKLKFMILKNREIIDEFTTDYGLASIKIIDSKINLNGKPI